MKNAASILSAVLAFGLAGCSLYSSDAGKPTSSENAETSPEESGGKSSKGSSGSATKSDPATSIAFKGPFVVGDGTGDAADAKCQSSLGAKAPPTTGALEFAIELQGAVTQLQVKAAKLCGGDDVWGASIALMKDGVTIAKEDLEFGDSADIVRDSTVTFTAEDEAGFEPGAYTVVVLADDSSSATESGAFNDIALGELDVGVIGSGKLVKVGDAKTGPRAEVAWSDSFSVGDNQFASQYENEAEELACRNSLGAGAATSNVKRFTIEIGGEVTDLAFELDKTCGGDSTWQGELRVYEGENLLLAKNSIAYQDQANVISSTMHVNADNAGRALTAGIYTLEVAADSRSPGFDDISASGVKAWVVGKDATISKK